MVDILRVMWDTVEDAMSRSQHVKVVNGYVDDFIRKHAEEIKSSEERVVAEPLTRDLVIMELVASSVNYCYWYGHPAIRPGAASAQKMYQLLKDAFRVVGEGYKLESLTKCFYEQMVRLRFPLLKERWGHLQELVDAPDCVDRVVRSVLDLKHADVDLLATSFPGFASDVFLKRAQLFYLLIQRRTHIFDRMQLKGFAVPADYQVPRVLRNFGMLEYSPELSAAVEKCVLIPRGSRWEVEIRAAAITACKRIASILDVGASEVDTVIWGARKSVTAPFHLTVTTDY